ncbi:MAG: PAS domain S-box protein [Elainella sp. C42_A2020_010]|nr:PAS domain S-box protein [Elainella sp. C42_A2020_010]RNJ67207.1 MAG: PAS domain S-box protein [Leptolyngbya sp. IPPAS B-1204]
MPKLNSLTLDCVVATGSVVIALLLMFGLDPWLGMTETPFLLFFGSVPIAALYRGRRGGLIATVLSALLANYFFIAPIYAFSLDTVGSSRTIIFLLEGILISILIGSLRRAQQQTKASLRQLKASESKFRRLVNSNVIGVVSADIYGAITDANDAFLNSVGYTRADLIAGRIRWDEMTPADLKYLDRSAYKELLTKGKNTPYEKAFMGKQGQRVPVVVGTALLEDNPEQIISFILDVSERKRAEQQLAIQYTIARALAEATAISDAISLVLQSLCESLGWQIGCFWRVDPQTQTLRYLHGWYSPGLDATALIQINQTMTFTAGMGLPGRIWERGEATWIPDVAEDAGFPRKAVALEVGLRSVFGFPVSLNQDILGVIECFSDRYQEPDQNLLQMVTAIGSQIGQFIERKQTEEELQASQDLFQSFMSYCPINAYIKDELGCYVYVNPSVERAFNRPLVEWLGKTDFDFFAADVAQTFRANDRAVLQSGQMIQVVELNPLDDDQPHYLSVKFPLKDATGRSLLGGMSIDISDRKRFEVERERLLQQLETSLGQLEAVINSMTEGLVIADPQGNILMFNPAALALHGYDSLEQVQQHLREFPNTIEVHDLQGNFVPMEQWPISRALQGETFSNCEIQIHRRDTGKTFIGSYGGTPVLDKQNQIILAIVTIRDVTAQKQAQAELARSLAAETAARAEAEAANRIKDEFLAVLSHELRTPLNPILGWIRLLRNGHLDAQQTTRALETIERNTKLQIQLIDDLLDISRILRGKLVLNVGPVDLVAVIEAAKETVRLAAEAKGIELRFIARQAVDEWVSGPVNESPNTSTPLQVMGDFNRLQQVVWNLLSNAVKFTPEGGRVEVRLERVDEGDRGAGSSSPSPPSSFGEAHEPPSSLVRRGSRAASSSFGEAHEPPPSSLHPYAQITVSDTGKGISPEFLPHIFEYFRQADSSITRQFGGLGLGLAIARQIVELHGGTIEAASPGEGQGATFTVTLPLWVKPVATKPEEIRRESPSVPPLPLAAIRILAVDDEADNLELVQFILEQSGATVRASTSATEALQQVEQFQPDVLLTDIGMPEMDGYTLLHKIRELLPEGGQIPAIALTAYAGEFNQQQALAAGFQQHIAKPVEPDTLVSSITMLLKSQ